jgi:hypothetical protein
MNYEALCWRSRIFGGRMFAGRLPPSPRRCVASGDCAQWTGSVLCEQSDDPVAPTGVRRYFATIEPALRYPDAGVPNSLPIMRVNLAPSLSRLGKPFPQRLELGPHTGELLQVGGGQRSQLLVAGRGRGEADHALIVGVVAPFHEAGGDRPVDQLDDAVVAEQEVRRNVAD